MRAIILAGGKGRRLQPYTTILPKPLMPIGDMSILEVLLRQLKYYNFRKITIAVGYHHELIRAVIKDGNQFGLNVEYSLEEKPLGTAGPINLIEDLEIDFLVVNGDTLTDLNFHNFMRFHKEKSAIASIAVYKRDVFIDFGVVKIDNHKYLNEYIEKPTYNLLVSMGIYAFKPEVKKYIEKGKRLDIPDLLKKIMQDKQKIACYEGKGFWLDIGRLDDYNRAIEKFNSNIRVFLKDYDN